jgi:hypothetical protein
VAIDHHGYGPFGRLGVAFDAVMTAWRSTMPP